MKIVNCKLKILSLALILLAFLYGQKVLQLPSVEAFTMSNDRWMIRMGNLNQTAGQSSGGNYKLGITVGEIASGLYSGTNFKVRAGFQYIHSIIRLRFAISETNINFGELSPTNPVNRTSTLTVSNGSAHGYSVTASENHQLLVAASGQLIPDTTCDNGSCTESTSALWSSTLTYGFGYRCDNITGTDCASGFTTANFFKQFADASKSETASAVMSGANVGRNIQTQITYKLNISGTQPAGLYTNTITYIITPTF